MKRKMKALTAALLAGSFLISAFGCGDDTDTTEELQNAELFAEIENASIEQFESVFIELIDEKSDVEWSSSNPQVAVVENGKLIGVSLGETVITATCGEEKQTQTKN